MLAQRGKHGKAVAVGQVQVEQNEIDAGVGADDIHRLADIRCLKGDNAALELLEHPLQRLADKSMVVDNQDFHPRAFGCMMAMGAAQLSLIIQPMRLSLSPAAPP